MQSLIFIISLFISFRLHADVFNRQIIPLGEKAAYMANTGTADSSASGAVYYNPACLAGIKDNKISVSGSVYFTFNVNFDALARIDNTNISYQAKGLNTIPSTYISTFKKWNSTFAFSVLMPDSIQVEGAQKFSTPNTSGVLTPYQNKKSIWAGLSGSRVLDEKWSIGATVFGIQYSNANQFATTVNFLTPSNTVASSVNRTDVTVYGLSWVLGLLYKASQDLEIGYRIQTPILQVAGTANTYTENASSISGTVSTQIEDKQGIPAHYDLPTDTTLGIAYRLHPKVKALLDLSYQWGVDYKSIPDSTISTTSSDAYVSDPTARSNAGLEWKCTDKMSVVGGFFYNPSSIHQLSSKTIGKIKADIFGTSAGLLLAEDHIQTGLGLFYLWGNGQSLLGPPDNLLVGTSVNGGGVLLTTSYVF